MKKRGFGQGMWNGTGGKVGKDETTKEAAKREAKEEFGVDLIKLKSMGKILFVFKDGLEHECYLYICDKWTGELSESEEMLPKWFKIEKIPFDKMWETDKHWLPKILNNKRIEAVFHFNKDAKTIEKYNLNII
jgi:8-oxo-dGTP pyrophosphatase MutT (NUDIX family)